MDQKRRIQLIRSNDASLPMRLSALEELYQLGTAEGLLFVCHAAYAQASALADRAREMVTLLGYTQCEGLINLLLEDHLNAYTRKRAFDMLREEKSQEILRYVVQHADRLTTDAVKSKTLAGWLRQTKLIHDWIRSILTLPMNAANQLAVAIKKVDNTFPLAVARIVKNGGPKSRIRAMDILAQIAEGRDIVPFVIGATVSENAELRSKAILVLGKTSDKLSIIENALSDEDSRVRANAVETLWGLDSDNARMLLRQAANDPHNRVRANAAKGLYEIGHPLGIRALHDMLVHEEATMRMSSAWVLGEVRALEMIPQLRILLKDANADVRRNAALALDKMGVRLLNIRRSFRYFKKEVRYFPDSDISSVKRFIAAAGLITEMSKSKLQPLVREVLESNPSLSQHMYRELKRHETDNVEITLLMIALFARHTALRTKATEMVARHSQDKEFFDISLEDDEPLVRRATVSALRDNLIADAQEILSSCLADPDPYVVLGAAEILHVLKDPRGVEVLSQSLSDAEPKLRIQAVEAVARSSITELMPYLDQIAESDSERSVRGTAFKALEELRRAEEEAVLRDVRVHIEHIGVGQYPTIQSYVSVLGESGQVVRGLKKEHFLVEETGIDMHKFELVTAPSSVAMSVVFVMDYSDTMADQDIRAMEQGVEQMIGQLPEGAKAAIVKYAIDVEMTQELTFEHDSLYLAVQQPYDGDTEGLALYDALFDSLETIGSEEGIRVLVAFASDNDDSSTQAGMKVLRYAANHQVTIHLVDCTKEMDKEKLQTLSRSTHGQFWTISPSVPVQTACRRAADILSYHYAISYHTTPKGTMRGIATLSVGVNYRQFGSRMTVPLPKA